MRREQSVTEAVAHASQLHFRFYSIVQKEGGTQFKLVVDFKDGGQALYKPMRFPRTQESEPTASVHRFSGGQFNSINIFGPFFNSIFEIDC